MEGNGSRTAGRASEQVQEGIRQLESELQERLEGLRGYAETVDDWIREFARERPLLAIGCAVGLGFVIGRIASRL